ncbi:MAG: CCA tRNA nucleotidyltransferase [Clostridia bacterium]|nr:CCA tRNA nucleotidyltransferase [Clostridia bacterium]
MQLKLNDSVKYIIEKLESAGQRADIVGGCVRDFLLGKPPHDFDITTSATPDEMREIFRDEHTLEVGLKHGTLTVILGAEPYEITTYRTEGDYTDHRHPSTVSFSRTLTDDLSRRDFTVNAICYSERHGFTDPFSGVADIEARVIRAVGEPACRFEEDALRILRALRFSSTLGFVIEEGTARAIREKAHLLEYISAERILTEYKKLMEGSQAYEVISEYPDIIAWVLSIPSAIRLLPRDRFASLPPNLRTLSLFALSADSPVEAFSHAADRLRLDNAARHEGEKILSSLDLPLSDEVDIKLAFMKIGAPYTLSLIKLLFAMGRAPQQCLATAERILASGAAYRISDLAIKGEDLTSLGIKGPEVGKTLTAAIIAVIRGECENTRDSIFRYLNLHA